MLAQVFPLSSTIEFTPAAELALALALGLGFGFALERAGFGSARKLTAVFYLWDMAVVKVMFTAIVTAMSGVALLTAAGALDLGALYVEPTNFAAAAIGGLLFGAGFVVGGYCPGTSVAAAATGKIDGLVFLAGIAAGTVGFAVVFPALSGFYTATPLGQVTSPASFGLPYGVVVFAVVVVALAGFWGAGLVERRFSGRQNHL